MQAVQETIAAIIREHGGPDTAEWLKAHEVDKPTDGDTLKLAYCKDPARASQRMKQRTGRFVRAHLWPNVTDVTLQTVAAAIDAALWGADDDDNGDGPVRELRGEDIRAAYRTSGIRSCMSGEHSRYLDIYVDNPDVVCLLFADMANGAARALVWTLPDGTRYLDREYSTSDSANAALRAYADKHGFSTRHPRQSVGVKLRNGIHGRWPYMDTFESADIDRDTATLYPNCDGEYGLRQTDGTCDGGRYVCCSCGDHMPEDEYESHDGDIYCSECYGERFTTCNRCGEDVYTDDMYYLENLEIDVCEHCRDHDYTQCDICGEWAKNDDTWEVDAENLDNVCDDCYKEKIRQCAECGTDFRIDENGPHTSPDGETYYCEECYEERRYETCPTCGQTHSKGIGCEDCDAARMYGDAILPVKAENPDPVPAQAT